MNLIIKSLVALENCKLFIYVVQIQSIFFSPQAVFHILVLLSPEPKQ